MDADYNENYDLWSFLEDVNLAVGFLLRLSNQQETMKTFRHVHSYNNELNGQRAINPEIQLSNELQQEQQQQQIIYYSGNQYHPVEENYLHTFYHSNSYQAQQFQATSGAILTSTASASAIQIQNLSPDCVYCCSHAAACLKGHVLV